MKEIMNGKPVNFALLLKLAGDGEMDVAEAIASLEMCQVPMSDAVRALGMSLGILYK